MKTATTLLVFCVSGLAALGLVMLYSAGKLHESEGARYFITQFLSFGIGLALCVAVASLDYRHLKKTVWILFGITVVLLVGVRLFTKPINGAWRWFRFGGFSFQPSELAKIAVILMLAWYGERFRNVMPTFTRGVVVPGLCVSVILALVVVEPDVGTTILIATVSAMMLLLAGMKIRYAALPVLLAAAGLAWFLTHNEVRANRIHSWLHLEETKLGTGRQAWQARMAFGSGGWTGRGLGSSRHKLGFVSEHHTDFIFPIIGEELGLPATLGVVALFALFAVSAFRIASCAPDLFGLLLGAGITFLISVQAMVNIAVVTGVFPNKGLPLPFISYGGSNLILMLGCVGILLSIARHGAERSRALDEELPSASPFAA